MVHDVEIKITIVCIADHDSGCTVSVSSAALLTMRLMVDSTTLCGLPTIIHDRLHHTFSAAHLDSSCSVTHSTLLVMIHDVHSQPHISVRFNCRDSWGWSSFTRNAFVSESHYALFQSQVLDSILFTNKAKLQSHVPRFSPSFQVYSFNHLLYVDPAD